MKEIVVLGLFLLAILAAGQTVQTGCLVQVPGSLKCQICSSNLQLDDQGHCGLYTPIEGCKVYNSTASGGCSQCSPTFLLQGTICVPMLANCIQTTSVYSCDRCADNYTLVRYSSCFSTAIANCPLGSLPRTVNSVSYCQKLSIISCDVPSADSSSCQVCSAGYSSINGICYQVLSSVPCRGNSCSCQGYFFNQTCYNIKISNCLSSSDKIYCDLCNDNYYASQGFCVKFTKPDDINCNLLTLDGTRCAGCNLNYVLDSDFICVRNFNLCPNGCSQCPTGLQLYETNCLPIDPLCSVYNTSKQACVLCLEGYQLDPRTMLCLKKVTCLARDQTGTCTSCFTGYQLDMISRQCLALPPNCQQMNTTSGVCAKCSDVTSLSPSGCIFPTTNCTSYDFNGRCQTCSEGYVQVRRFCLPIASNCQAYGSDRSKCSVCNKGYHLYSTLCYPDIDGCLSYLKESYCSLCSTNYQLINGNCFFRDPNCVAQDAFGLCLGCRLGYLPSRGRCVFFDPYCLSYNLSSLVCDQAFGGFSAAGMDTQQRIAYQDFVTRAQNASKSALDYEFVGTEGQGSYSRNGIINWLPYDGVTSSSVGRCSLNGNILSCKTGYTLVDGRCVKALANAYSYDQYGNILQCNPGYDILVDGSCAVRSTSTCASQAGGVCLAAASGFTLVNGAAVASSRFVARSSAEGLVVSALAGYFVWKEMNVAWPLDVNCISQFTPGICVSCAAGFSIWNDGRCVFFKSNCVAYSWAGLCMACSDGYILWAGECRRSNCASIDASSKLCLVCSPPFTMSLRVCLPPALPSCQVYQNGSCLYCIQGYYLTASGLCSKMIDNCQSANPQTGRCLSCQTNYTYYTEQCIKQIKNCDVYSSSLQSCQTCAQLYYPISGGTVCGYLGLYCAVLADANNCAQCKTGLNLVLQNGVYICARPITNCYWYDGKTNCLICNTGYVLQFNACKSIRCANFFPPQSRCDACLAPFKLENNYCKDPNCLNSTGQVCLACLPRYYLKDGVCSLISDQNCQTVTINGTCLKCIVGFSLNVTSGLCVANDTSYNGCLRQEYPCTVCASGYLLRADGLCWARKCSVFKANRDCQTCIYYYDLQPTQRFCIIYTCASPSCYFNDNPPDGFYLDTNGNFSITYCLTYNGPDCTACSNYRYPSPSVRFGLCYPYNCQIDSILNCTSNCLPYFTNVVQYPGSCVAGNCSAYDTNGRCLSCLQIFTLSNGTCRLFQIDNCSTIDYVSRVCSICNGGFISWEGLCRPANCSQYGADNKTCVTCLQGFVILKGICQPGKCSNIQNQNCLECLPGYYLQNGLCYASNCLTFDYANLVCLSCSASYEVVTNLGVCKPSNCISYTPSLQSCLQCVGNYVLANGLCIRGDPNCLKFDPTGLCLQCKDNMVIANGACIAKVPACNQYGPSGCLACLPAYELKNGLCYARYCQNYSTADYCLGCQSRWSIQSDGSCLPKNCVTFDRTQWQCTACQPRFQLISSFCFTYNCSSYQIGVYQCQRCQPGFTLVGETCTFSNCLAPSQYTCASCLPGFTLSDGLCKGPQDNCVQYDFSLFVCTQCSPGFNLSTYGLCQSTYVDPYCLSVQPSSGQCLQCLPSFTYNPASLQCESSYCASFNPTVPQRNRVCVSCLPGFVLDSSQRYCISLYCLRYDLSSGNCWACVGGSTLNNNVCYANFCSKYSPVYPSSPVCQTCKDGYQLNSNSLCVPQYCSSLNLDLSCAVCSSGYTLTSSGICQMVSCDNGFVFLNGQCTPANCQYYNKTAGGCGVCLPGFIQERQFCIAQGCLSYSNKYVCLQCAQGYSLRIVNGVTLCVLDISSACPSGYYFSNNNCNAIPIGNCSISDGSGQNCYRCLDGYLLRNNVCYLIDGCLWPSFITGCNACIPGYVLRGFLCISLNCLQLNPDNTCSTCLQGYTLVSGVCQRSIYKCLQLDSNGNCLNCQSSFQLTNGRCIAIGCLTYSPATFVCLQCAAGYILKPDETCEVKITIPHCFSPVNATFCGVCDNGYIQFLGKCYLRINWCLNYYQQNGLCSNCSAGYYVNYQGQCVPLPSFCQQADINGKCQLCNQGYRVFVGQCLPNIQFCSAFDPNSGYCLTCMPNYYLTSDNTCQYMPAFCTGALPSGACTGCQTGYELVAGSCVVRIAYCLIYNTNNPAYCFQCTNGYYLNSRYGCSVLPPFCTAADGTGVCLSCISGYSLVDSICVVAVQNCVKYVQMTNSTRCSQCASGYNLTSDFSCSSLPLYCAAGANGACTSCISGYQLYQNICVVITNNCRYWSMVSLQCSDCLAGYYLALNNTAVGYICMRLPQYCLRADLYGGCLQCLDGYTIYNQQCVDTASIRFCRVYNLTTFACLQCVAGYTLNSNSRCLPRYCSSVDSQGNCVTCLAQYQLIGNVCMLQISNCVSYNTNSGLCLACASGYTLSSDGMNCIVSDPYCASMGTNGLCLSCMTGYYLTQGRCYAMPAGCASIGLNGYCQACLSQYVLVAGGTCVLRVAQCQNYNSSGCSVCVSMYYLQANTCRAYPLGCLSYEIQSGRCLNCASDFQLNYTSWTCSRRSDCQNSNGNQCVYCPLRYYLSMGQCRPYPSYCVSVDLQGNCISCAFGSVLTGNSCLPTEGRKLNCITFDNVNSICLTCADGYSLCPATGVCVRPDPGCQNFTLNGQCIACLADYVLYRGQCLLYPPGVILLPNGAVSCRGGYTLVDGSCLRNQNTLNMASSQPSACSFGGSSGISQQQPFLGSSYYWRPNSVQLNQYISVTFSSGRPQAIFQLGIRGTQQGWVSGYVLQFKNRNDAPWICWNGCDKVAGNSDGGSTSWLKLFHPIVATELRIYPVSWVGDMALQVDLWMLTFN